MSAGPAGPYGPDGAGGLGPDGAGGLAGPCSNIINIGPLGMDLVRLLVLPWELVPCRAMVVGYWVVLAGLV